MEQKFCQSCGMPMQEENEFGTNSDETKNEEYCVYCFKNGGFTQDVTMEEMIAISLKHMEELNLDMGKDEALRRMNQFFPQLKRWKSGK